MWYQRQSRYFDVKQVDFAQPTDLRKSGLKTKEFMSAHIRPAKFVDARKISRFYHRAYASNNPTDAVRCYPWPQLLRSDWVEEAIKSGTLNWLVAEVGEEVVGTVAAKRNIGSFTDRVAECFGLVVEKEWQRKGFAQQLMASLVGSLDGEAAIMIGETRTADSFAYSVISNAGWIPFGFEPSAHKTPVGSEPMILMGRIAKTAVNEREETGTTSKNVRNLGQVVLAALGLSPMSVKGELASPVFASGPRGLKKDPAGDFCNIDLTFANNGLRIEEGIDTGRIMKRGWPDERQHASGVVQLDHMVGEDLDGDRFRRKCFVAFAKQTPLACTEVFWDRIDNRARILYLHTRFDGLQGPMLAHIVEALKQESIGSRLSIVVDVRADRPSLQATLEFLSFFPTGYYPGLIATSSGRVDAVQYTHLYQIDINESLKWVRDVKCENAKKVVNMVTALEKKTRLKT